MKQKIDKNGILLEDLDGFSLEMTLFCGQCFRWSQPEPGVFTGMAGNRFCTVIQRGESLFFPHMSQDELPFWLNYFDLETDYAPIRALLSQEPVLREAIGYAGGIRILRQDPWEALASFILSQNNNIKRITGLVERLCESFGTPISGTSQKAEKTVGYGFPSARRLASLTVEDLAPVRAGFRAKYLLDAAGKVVSGEVSLEKAALLPVDEGALELQKIQGVGPKVARCALLFGCQKIESLPVDTWVRKILARLYPHGLPSYAQPYAGIAQQYLFHYIRTFPERLKEPVAV